MMQPQATTAPPMVVTTAPDRSQMQPHFMDKCVKWMSISEIVIGILGIILQFILISIQSPLWPVVQGIWSGIIFILTGSFGVMSCKKKTTCPIITFLVLSIISAIAAIGLIAPSAIEWSFFRGYFHYYSNSYVKRVTGIAATMVFMGIAMLVLSIVSAAFASHGVCGANKSSPTVIVAGQVQYITGPNGEQQMVVVPFNQQGAVIQGPSTAIIPSVPYPGQNLPGHPGASGAVAQPHQPPSYSGQATPPPEYQYEMKVPLTE